MEKVKYNIHHQVVADCPKCGEMCIEDLGEFDDADGMEMECPHCGTDFELEGKAD